jgi:hypothetical protein
MNPSGERPSRRIAKGRKHAAPRQTVDRPGWNEFETGLRGLRNLNAMQLELIASLEQIGKQLRRKRV